ncbi:hypothetical protein ABH920_009474 [Catenulispora sp. EB89]
MLAVREVSEQYSHDVLIRPGSSAPGVCPVCRTWVYGNSPCSPCRRNQRLLGAGTADLVTPISLSVKGRQLARELRQYKHPHLRDSAEAVATRLACVCWRFLAEHESCLADAALIDSQTFDMVTIVPSASGRRGEHPLRRIVATVVAPTRDRYADLLEPTGIAIRDHECVPNRYRTLESLSGKSVLLVDDTWTTGAHAQCASSVLKAAGAARVVVLVLGRYVNPEFTDHRSRIREALQKGFSWGTCCVHRE